MTLIVMMIAAAAGHVWERHGRLEAVVTALGLAYIFAVCEALE